MSIQPDAFLGQPAAKMLLLGTFHFQDRGLDRYKPQERYDIFSEQRQNEVAEVVERLAKYQPSKIAVERTPEQQAEIDDQYRAYLQGEFQLPGDEVYQLGFKLAKQMGHRKIYCVNNWGRHYEPPVDLDEYARKHHQEKIATEWWSRFSKLYEYGDRLKNQMTLREFLLYGNSEEQILRGHGNYLVDHFKLGKDDEYPGVDWVTGWYNRNLRIFANLQRITELPDERLLLIIGGGHIPIIRHCVLASPEYKLIEVNEYLG